jgi:ATP-dependent exoDNAse (exonuclease V) beta subunit
MADLEARLTALTAHERTLLVEAGAGSGKTALLAGRIALMCAAGIAPRAITAITFTEAAASELRERIETYMMRLCEDDIPGELALALPNGISKEQHAALSAAEAHFDELICTTIHGFCQRLIEPYPVEAILDPGATVLEGTAAELMREEVVTDWLSTHFGREKGGVGAPQTDPDDILVALIEESGVEAIGKIRQWAEFLCERRDARPCAADESGSVARELRDAVRAFEAWYNGSGLQENKTAEWLAGLIGVAALVESTGVSALSNADLITLLRHEPPSACLKDKTEFRLYRCKGDWERAAKAVGLPGSRGAMLHAEGERSYWSCGDAYKQWSESLAELACSRIVGAMSSLQEEYRTRKQRTAVLDFDDLLVHARDLVRDHAHVRTALARRYPHLLVDEFQDTDPLQAELLWRLCGEENAERWEDIRPRRGSLFAVADPKQAIYRFRGADIATYLMAKHSLCATASDTLLEITTNFRSNPGILAFVNTTFRPLLETPEQPGFTSLDAARAMGPGVALQRISVDSHLDGDALAANSKLAVDDLRIAEARAVGEAVSIFLRETTIVDRGTKRERACAPGDIALLSATGSSLWRYEQELEMLNVPIASQAGKGFFRRQEIHDLIALVRVLADPADTVALGAFLRGPLIGLTEEQIADAVLEAEAAESRLGLWTPISSVESPILREALAVLQLLARKARKTTPFHVVAEAVELFNMRSLLLLRLPRSAERALANIERFLTLAQEYDVRGLFVFARSLRERWNDAERQEEGRLDQVKDAVIISTMHSSKGLEWPIVIPINSMTKLSSNVKSIFLDRSDRSVHFRVCGKAGARQAALAEDDQREHAAEAVRLWYVALTRARDMLALPQLTAARPKEDWMSVVPLRLEELPLVDGVARRYAPPPAEPALAQDGATWSAQSSRIAGLARTVTFQYPSRDDEKSGAAPLESISIEAELDSGERVKGSRERGILLHKLLEEVIMKELDPRADRLLERAQELHTQLNLDPERVTIDLDEVAACVARTLKIEEIADLLPRLTAEVPLYASQERASEIIVTAGFADAVALDAEGNCEVVIDWKSDVDPGRAPVDKYLAQLATYLHMTKAGAGMIVFVTTGGIVRHPGIVPKR